MRALCVVQYFFVGVKPNELRTILYTYARQKLNEITHLGQRMEPIVLITIIITCAALLGTHVLTNIRETRQRTRITEDLRRLQEELHRQNNDARQEVRQHIGTIQEQLISGLASAQNTAQSAQKSAQDLLQKESEKTSRLIEEITGKLTNLERTNKQVLDYSSQLQQLQNILKNPKQRGVLGEYWLGTLLGNILPKSAYSMQYRLGQREHDGNVHIADAVLFVNDLIIPIDAKFTLENYNRMIEETDNERRQRLETEFKKDIQNRIVETAKYIQPHNKTTDFAFMFVPAEGVYYHLINAEQGSGVNSQNLLEFAFKHKVMIVAPMNFYAYLQTVVFGLNQLHIEAQTQEIKTRVEELRRHMHTYADGFRKLGGYLSQAVSSYNKTGGELRKVDKDMQRITLGKASEEQTIQLDGVMETPRIEE